MLQRATTAGRAKEDRACGLPRDRRRGRLGLGRRIDSHRRCRRRRFGRAIHAVAVLIERVTHRIVCARMYARAGVVAVEGRRRRGARRRRLVAISVAIVCARLRRLDRSVRHSVAGHQRHHRRRRRAHLGELLAARSARLETALAQLGQLADSAGRKPSQCEQVNMPAMLRKTTRARNSVQSQTQRTNPDSRMVSSAVTRSAP